MTIEAVVTFTGRPGVHLGGEIESGVIRVGDLLDLLDGGKLVKVVRCDGLGSFNRIGGTDRCLPSVHCASLSPGEVREGQVLAGTELRREEDGALPGSLSGPCTDGRPRLPLPSLTVMHHCWPARPASRPRPPHPTAKRELPAHPPTNRSPDPASVEAQTRDVGPGRGPAVTGGGRR
jgi:hypothetical protein